MTNESPYRPGGRILEVARQHPERIALMVDGESWSYAELVAAAQSIMADFGTDDGPTQPVTAVMAGRHVSSYAGILAARLAGHAYVPLNVAHPRRRNATILAASAAGRIVCGDGSRAVLEDILAAVDLPVGAPPIVGCADAKSGFDLREAGVGAWPAGMSDLAYILFTSGSTGNPKGVPIRNSELETYLAAAGPLVDPQPDDRFSQTFELTFDLSVHDLFICWENGATLVVASEKELRMPSAYIRDHGISCWFSVPSLAYQVRLQEDLVPGAFPSLRLSLFCGEALPWVVASEWARAAPNSRVENWYGPTEATIACSRFELRGDAADEDTVPIGKAFPGMELLVLDESLAPQPPDRPGELFLCGGQVAAGYLNDPDKTARSFIGLPDGRRAYRTGDRAVIGEDGEVRFLGRVDNQVKVRGFRIELGEIEAALRSASGGLNAVAMPWPGGPEIATSIIAALEIDSADTAGVRVECAEQLPDYMVPSKVFCVPEFPKNASGKIDRKGLADLLAERAAVANAGDDPGLSPEANFLLRSVLTHAPLLDRDAVLTAKTLFDAGMNSLAFISVTTDIEHEFGMSLDQDTVIQLSEMSFGEIVREARGETQRLQSVRADADALPLMDRLRKLLGIPRVIRKPRANRALHFIERFPAYLAERGAPDVLAVGSSGMFRAFCPPDFEEAAAQLGMRVTALNAGFPAVSAAGMHRLCEFIRVQCEAAGVRVPLVLYEFDPMHLSTTPPSGDINLSEDFFTGNVIPLRGGRTNPEFEWLAESRGAWNAPAAERQKDRKPKWIRDRDRVIAGIYLGEVEFDPVAVGHWYAGARALLRVCDGMTCFLHPADREMTDEIRGSCGSDRLVAFTREIGNTLGIEVLSWEAFELEPGDFLDINHMNARGGREKLSRQLAGMVFAAAARSATG